jgi:hypothetical protein
VSINEYMRKKAYEVLEKVTWAVDYWCNSISGDPPEACYRIHMEKSLYEVAELMCGWSYSEITEWDLEFLGLIPDDLYNKIEEKYQKHIEDMLKVLEKEREIDREIEDNIDRVLEEAVEEEEAFERALEDLPEEGEE